MTDAWSREVEESGSGRVIRCGEVIAGVTLVCGQSINGTTVVCGQTLAMWSEETEAEATES